MSRVAVIGGGISGLTVSFRLHQRGHDVVVFEASDRTGGAIRSTTSDGFLVEHGPNTIQTRTPHLESLIADVGLADQIIEADARAARRYIVRGGRPIALPSGPPAFLATRLFSPAAKLRLLREPFIAPSDPAEEETVAAFVRRRLGPEFLDYAINPFVAGVFAGDPERLSLRHAFPRLHEIEQTYGSLIRGLIRLARERREATAPMPKGRLISLRHGLQGLPGALTRHLGSRVRLTTPVRTIRQESSGWRVISPSGDEAFDAIVYAGPIHGLPSLLPDGVAAGLPALRTVEHPPISVLALGFRRHDVTHPLDGFGMLVPARESAFRILGALFTSSLFAGRAPEGHVLLTTFIGGMRHPDLASSDTPRALDVALPDLRALLGIRGEPTFVHHTYWPQAIPQYAPGYGQIKQQLAYLEDACSGLFFAGNYRNGISVNDSVQTAEAVTLRITGFLDPS